MTPSLTTAGGTFAMPSIITGVNLVRDVDEEDPATLEKSWAHLDIGGENPSAPGMEGTAPGGWPTIGYSDNNKEDGGAKESPMEVAGGWEQTCEGIEGLDMERSRLEVICGRGEKEMAAMNFAN